MTKVQAAFKLSRALGDHDLANISRLHSVYGIFVARVRPGLDELFVEYDASRLSPKDVDATLRQFGIPLV